MNNEDYKTTIITGGSRGLGRNTAVNLARRGVDILFTYHSNASEARSLVREAEAIGRKAAAFQLDAGNISTFDRDGVNPEFREFIKSFRPMQRMGTPDDVANVAEYLAGDLASFISGQHLLVTGGAPA